MKIFLFTILALCSSLLVTATNRTDDRYLSLEKLARILRSEVVSAISFDTDDPEQVWLDLLHVEQERLLKHSSLRRSMVSSDGLKTPFIVCDAESGRSGELRKKMLVDLLSTKNLLSLYNKNDMSCFSLQSSLPEIRALPANFEYAPILPEAKVPDGTMETITDPTFEVARLEVVLCPGPMNQTLVLQDIEDVVKKSHDHRRVLRVENFAASRKTHASIKQRRFWQRMLRADAVYECEEMFANAESDSFGDSLLLAIPSEFQGEEWRSCLESMVWDLALRDDVCFIGVYENPQTLNDVAAAILQGGGAEKATPLYEVGLDGTGQLIQLSDTGVDLDNCYFFDSEQNVPVTEVGKVRGPVNVASRKIVQYVSFADASENASGHGTHVAASIAGRRSDNGRSEQAGRGDGLARAAKLAFFDIGTPQSGLKIPLISTMFSTGYRDAGARIHSASWGSPSQNSYSSLDYNADSFLFNNPEFLFVVAAGNNGRDRKSTSIASPGHTKNGITVGASQNDVPHINSGMLGADYLAEFSSRGPSGDGRRKPDVVAPGLFIQSARAQPETQGECDETGGLGFKAGTSMSTPLVAGAAALVRQYFVDGWHEAAKPDGRKGFEPRASLLKAVLLNGAERLLGIQDDQTQQVSNSLEYDMNQGYGRVNLLNSLPIEGRNSMNGIFINSKKISTGQDHVYTVKLSDSTACDEPLSATLTWTDPPVGPLCSNCVLNDLDLSVISSSDEVFYPNGLNEPDNVNNAERVRIFTKSGSGYTVHVTGRQLVEPQEYSLVITGCLDLSSTGATVSPTEEPTDAPITTPSVPSVNPCDDSGTSIAVRGGTKTCQWLQSQSVATKDFFCRWLDVAHACPQTCKTCDENFDFGSVLRSSSSLSGSVRYFGNMFDLLAHDDITLVGFDVHLFGSSPVVVEVWTRPTGNEWTKMCESSVVSRGRYETVEIPESDCAPVDIASGSILEVYVTVEASKDMIMVPEKDWKPNTADFTLSNGSAVAYFDSKRVSGYGFDGEIRYRRSCADKTTAIEISDWVGRKTCQWLKNNIDRMEFACAFAPISLHCPVTCGRCVA